MIEKNKRGSILFICPDIRFFISHRLNLINVANTLNLDTVIAGNWPSGKPPPVPALRVYNLPQLFGFWSGFLFAIKILRLTLDCRPDVIHIITMKGLLFSSFATYFCRRRVISITGLGSVFGRLADRNRCGRWFLISLFRILLKKSDILIVQNQDDYRLIRYAGISEENTILLRGVGIRFSDFAYVPVKTTPPYSVVMPSRVIRDKGVIEYIEAVKIFRTLTDIDVRFKYCGGFYEDANPSAIRKDEFFNLLEDAEIEYLGEVEDIIELFQCTTVVVLPSYREGFPKVLIEASAVGRPVVTTNVPGCREAIVPGATGLLCEVRSSVSLAESLVTLLGDDELLAKFGEKARTYAKSEFSEDMFIGAHERIYSGFFYGSK